MKKHNLRKRELRSKEQGCKLSSHVLFLNFYFLILILFTACQQKSIKEPKEAETEKTYTCSMHPQIIENHPGTCPICKMDLVLQHQDEVKMVVDASLSNLIMPTNETVISNIKTFKVIEQNFGDSILLNGKVNYNTNNMKSLSARVGGRIEKLYVKYNFQKVSKGQKIMEIYSPELAVAQQELLYLIAKGDAELLTSAKTKLRLLGVEESQINQIIKGKKVNYHLPVYSGSSGYIIDAAMSKENLNEPSSISTENTAITLKEGAYVKTGDILFKIFNNNQVWGEFYINPNEAVFIKRNQLINITSNDKKINAKIDLIQPYYNDGQNYTVLRVYLNNTNQTFKVGELLTGKITFPFQKGLWIPSSAIYKLGNRSIVFIKQKNVLTAKEVEISGNSGSKQKISKGLKLDDEIAENASYLIDTESFIKIN